MRTRLTFDWVGVKGVKKFVDANGKKRQITKHFRQTRNPFNRNEDGTCKTSDQILAEEKFKRDEWMKESS